jgi:hypothetical protein
MQTPQAQSTMQKQQAKPASGASAEHHTQAAECCNKAAAEHSNAAKACTSGDHDKADQHAQNAKDHCTKALDHGKQAKAA